MRLMVAIVRSQVDRRSLPRHEFGSTAAYVAPANPVEEAVESAWNEVLGLPQDQPVSVEANWFEVSVLVCCNPHCITNGWHGHVHKCFLSLFAEPLSHCPAQIGGNSLQTGSVCSRVRSALGLDANIPAAWLFMHQTIRAFAAKIAQDVLAPGAVHVAPLLPTVSRQLADPAEGIHTPTQLSFQQVTLHTMAEPGCTL
jgi:hypothetical protein